MKPDETDQSSLTSLILPSRWPKETEYLEEQCEETGSTDKFEYFKDMWNIYEWAMYFSVLIVVIVRY